MNMCTDCGHEIINNSQSCNMCECDDHDSSTESVEEE